MVAFTTRWSDSVLQVLKKLLLSRDLKSHARAQQERSREIKRDQERSREIKIKRDQERSREIKRALKSHVSAHFYNNLEQ